MSPRPITVRSSSILKASLSIIRRSGLRALSARAVAEKLRTSVAPIYRVYASMDELVSAALDAALDLLDAAMQRPFSGSPFRAAGVGIVTFAGEEPQLYRALFLEPHNTASVVARVLRRLEDATRATPALDALTDERRAALVMDAWLYTHGLASMVAARMLGPLDAEWVAAKLQQVGGLLIGAALATTALPAAPLTSKPARAASKPTKKRARESIE